jgi:DHA2 family multidrug resistance protein-like MFS transporter
MLLPEYRDPEAGRLDLTSVALPLATILPVIYGVKEQAQDGLESAPMAAVIVGLAFGVVFVRRQRRLTSPLLDMSLFRSRSLSAALGIGLGGSVVMAGTFSMVTLYLQTVEGLSPLHAGLWLVPMNLAMVASTVAAPQLARRFRWSNVWPPALPSRASAS